MLADERKHAGDDRRRAPPRVVIEDVDPEIDGGRFPAKRILGDRVAVSASVFAEGHDRLAGVLRHRLRGVEAWTEVPLRAAGNDRWRAEFCVDALGVHEYTLLAWVDRFETWRDGLAKKVEAGLDVASELLEGAAWVADAAERAAGEDARWLEAQAETLAAAGSPAARTALALSGALRDMMARHPDRAGAAAYARVLPLVVERERAAAGAWYEFFPRSCAAEPGRHGTLRDCTARLRHAAVMGFDVVYLPPVHPIGYSHRKGPDNAESAEPADPGSPWAIGAAEGGHCAVHPDLGSLDDFDALVAEARGLGLEVALDLAFQCSPDHPWVKEHPEWFRHRPDGSIQYAENPPKKYQDVYPLDFETGSWRALWQELLEVVLFWIGHGVSIFRVDNPHTKPFPFWEWLISEVRARHPEVVFLSEAFTRPSVLRYLAKAGFSQSYTYFTWRNTRHELITYLTELTRSTSREYLRPNFFTNTPDILPEFLQFGGRAGFQIRLLVAATLGGSYGIYGPPFELCVADAVPGTEEYRHSEKYEVRHWDLAQPGNLRDFIRRVNAIRRECVALRRGDLSFLPVEDERLLAFVRHDPEHSEIVVVVVDLDPHHPASGWLELPLEDLGIDPERPYQMDDLLGGARYLWNGPRNWVALDPSAVPGHVFRVRRRIRSEKDFDYYL
jgi:starch synthase (maltosyl-transferring)